MRSPDAMQQRYGEAAFGQAETTIITTKFDRDRHPGIAHLLEQLIANPQLVHETPTVWYEA